MVTDSRNNPRVPIKRNEKPDDHNDLGVIWNADHTKILIDHRPGKDKKPDE